MALNTGIEWADDSLNLWVGCEKVSSGCKFCYAARDNSRYGLAEWGKNGTRTMTTPKHWRKLMLWNEIAGDERRVVDTMMEYGKPLKFEELWDHVYAKYSFDIAKTRTLIDRALYRGLVRHTGEAYEAIREWNPPRVFINSWADFFEEWNGPIQWADKQTVYVDDDGMPFPKGPQYAGSRPCTMDDLRRNSFACFGMCHNLNFLLVTKRPENVPEHLTRVSPGPIKYRPNVWLGVSVESDQFRFRVESMQKVRNWFGKTFVSAEPLIGAIDFRYEFGLVPNGCGWELKGDGPRRPFDWLIVGCESGHDRRKADYFWVEKLVFQSRAAGVPVFVKQMEVDGRVCGDVTKFPMYVRKRELPYGEFANVCD